MRQLIYEILAGGTLALLILVYQYRHQVPGITMLETGVLILGAVVGICQLISYWHHR